MRDIEPNAVNELPVPDAEALSHSRALSQRIAEEIQQNGGAIDFSRYMELALYEPGLGYYSAGASKIGAEGDFITAPEVSSLFSLCLARQCLEIIEDPATSRVMEIGAGRGVMACDLLQELERLQCLPEKYLVLETSADLRARQQELMQQRIPGLLSRVEWLDSLPGEFNGVILANEVLDALPARRFVVSGETISELSVRSGEQGFEWCDTSAGESLVLELNRITRTLKTQLPGGYRSEINLGLRPWLSSLSDCLANGLMLFIDYGYPRHEYYHEQRRDGTLLCHYRHRVHDDPFIYPGLQDITTSVDFTAVAEAAVESGLEVKGFTTQAFFLLGCGLEKIMQDRAGDSEQQRVELARQVKLLTLPAEMGEKFKVIGLARGVERALSGFSIVDHRHRL